MMVGVLNAVSLVKGVYQLADSIYKCVQQVKANRSQCQRLAGRIRVIVEAIAQLDQLPETTQFGQGLEHLEQSLRECYELVQEFTEQKRWWIQALKYDRNAKEFARLNEELQRALADLNLSIQVKQIANREQDSKDQKTDAVELKAQQEKILACYQKNQLELKAFKGAFDQRERMMTRQLDSIKCKLEKLLPDKDQEKKPLLPPDLEIPFFALTLKEKIGEGAVATVYTGEWEGQPVAIKMLSAALSGREGMEFVREVQILSRLRSPFVVPFYGACLEEGHACLVMEYLSLGSLADYLSKNKLTLVQQKQIAVDIIRGLQYLHNKGILHSDLRGANILLTADRRARIADFGLTQTQAFSIQSLHKISPAVAWCAPELLRESKMTAQCDIYSLGTLLWELFTGKKPFVGITIEVQMKKILEGKRETISAEISVEWKQIITACWSHNPQDRPALTEVLSRIESFDPVAAHYQRGKQAEEAKDYKMAATIYRQATECDYAAAFTSLAILMLMGKGVTQDKAQAFQLLLIAANKGHCRAMKNAAIMLDKGDGIAKDQRKALFWYRRAAEAGDQEALKRAQRLDEKLSVSL